MKKVKSIFQGMDKILLLVTIVLFLFGLINIVTASSQATVVHLKNSVYDYFYNQSIFLIIGLILFLMVITTKTRNYYLLSIFGYFLIVFLLLMVSIRGKSVGGNKNWLPIGGGFSIQPSEFAKPVLIMCLATYYDIFYKKLRTTNISHVKIIAILMVIGLTFPVLVLTHKDMGTALVLLFIFAIMFWYSPILMKEKLKIVLGIVVLAVVGIIVAITCFPGKILTKSQLSRLTNFWDPCSRYEESGYQICNGYIAINSGGLVRWAPGKSKQKSYIPESHTDSVFAIIAEEYGFIPCTFIILLYMLVLFRTLRLASIAHTTRGKYICLGVATYIFLHIFINLGGLFGIMPLTGIPLPFLSYGGSYTIALIVSLGMVQRVSIEVKNRRIRIS